MKLCCPIPCIHQETSSPAQSHQELPPADNNRNRPPVSSLPPPSSNLPPPSRRSMESAKRDKLLNAAQDIPQADHPAQTSRARSRSVTRVPRPLSPETKKRIIERAADAFRAWKPDRRGPLFQDPDPHEQWHVLAAVLLDAINECHCTGKFDKAASILDDDFNNLYHKTIDELQKTPKLDSKTAAEFEKLNQLHFKPAMDKITDMICGDLAKVPVLNEVAPEHWSNLIIDPVVLARIGTQGADINNPLLMLMFDPDINNFGKRSYALGMLKGWHAAMTDLDRPFDSEYVLDLNAACLGSGLGLNGMSFGALASHDGMLRIADFMKRMAEKGITTKLTVGSNRLQVQYTQTPTGASQENTVRSLGTKQTAPFVSSLLETKLRNKEKETFEIKFTRQKTHEEDEAKEARLLRTAIDELLAPVREIERRMEGPDKPSRDEILRAAARMYLDIETLHGLDDGNFRLCLLLINRLLAKARSAGIPVGGPVMIWNPWRSDGSSVEEVVAMLEQGQKRCELLLKPVRDAMDADPSHLFHEMAEAVSTGDCSRMATAVMAAKFYPEGSPSFENMTTLFQDALARNSPAEIRFALTELPRFSVDAAGPDARTWLSLAAGSGNEAACVELLRKGADPGKVARHPDFAPAITRLLDAADAIRLYAGKAGTRHWPQDLEPALQDYDLKTIAGILDRDSDGWQKQPLENFTHWIKDHNALLAVAVLALSSTEMRDQMDSLAKSGRLKDALCPTDPASGRPLLHQLARDASSRPDALRALDTHLAFIEAAPCLDASEKLSMLTDLDSEQMSILHHAVLSGNVEVVRMISDFAGKFDNPAKVREALIPLSPGSVSDESEDRMPFAHWLIRQLNANFSLRPVFDACLAGIAETSNISEKDKLQFAVAGDAKQKSVLHYATAEDNIAEVRKLLRFINGLDVSDEEKLAAINAKDSERFSAIGSASEEACRAIIDAITGLDVSDAKKAEAIVDFDPETNETILSADIEEDQFELAEMKIRAVLQLNLSVEERLKYLSPLNELGAAPIAQAGPDDARQLLSDYQRQQDEIAEEDQP